MWIYYFMFDQSNNFFCKSNPRDIVEDFVINVIDVIERSIVIQAKISASCKTWPIVRLRKTFNSSKTSTKSISFASLHDLNVRVLNDLCLDCYFYHYNLSPFTFFNKIVNLVYLSLGLCLYTGQAGLTIMEEVNNNPTEDESQWGVFRSQHCKIWFGLVKEFDSGGSKTDEYGVMHSYKPRRNNSFSEIEHHNVYYYEDTRGTVNSSKFCSSQIAWLNNSECLRSFWSRKATDVNLTVLKSQL